MSPFAGRLAEIRSRITAACARAGRSPNDVTLVAVTKNQPLANLREAYDAGLRVFGENRVQDALAKMPELPSDIEWHMIGRLQSNKTRLAADHFSAIQTLESIGQLRELEKAGRIIDGLIQVNVGGESQKSGISPVELDEFHQSVLQCKVVRFRGLMTIGPLHSDSEQSRPVFRELARMGREVGSEWLSMGMSDDFEIALEEGATHVRIGSALFGPRSMD